MIVWLRHINYWGIKQRLFVSLLQVRKDKDFVYFICGINVVVPKILSVRDKENAIRQK